MIVTVDVEAREGSATEVAVMVTEAGAGTAAGAVYKPVVEMAPQAAPAQPAPDTDQVTPLFCESLETVAVNGLLRRTFKENVAGVTLTEMDAVMVMAAVEVLLPSAMEVAVSVMVFGDGAFGGAL